LPGAFGNPDRTCEQSCLIDFRDRSSFGRSRIRGLRTMAF
jgi:hypothetical protein